MTASSNFKVIQLNVNSIKSKIKCCEFVEFLKKHSPQIVLLSETKLNESDTLVLPGYKLIQNDRHENNGGGTAVCFKENLDCECITVPKKIK